MLYAQVNEWPRGYEEVEWLANELKLYDRTYSVTIETKMFSLRDWPDFVISIIRWGEGNTGVVRHPLATFSSVSEATGMLRLLIGNAKEMRG